MSKANELKTLSSQLLLERLEKLVQLEKRTTAEIVDYINEVDRRRLYLELGHTNLFSFLTKGLGYTPASAQRRIDSARLMQSMPEIKDDLRSGALNLMQASLVAQSVRQKQKEDPKATIDIEDKRELIAKVKNQDVAKTQAILAEALDLDLKVGEKKRQQKDESVRLELTLSKMQMERLARVKELLSHQNPTASWVEVIDYLAQDYIKRKDPLVEKPAKQASASTAEAVPRQEAKTHANQTDSQRRPSIPVAIRRQVFQRDRCCKWQEGNADKICGATFQLEIDHRVPVWAGGSSEIGNLQLLCRTHNARKYREQAGIRTVG